ncbi:MAG: hypothetical protein ACRD2L_09380, partial [Terriglobia bacterium]
MAIKGWGAPEVADLYTRALELCRQAGETAQLFPALEGLAVFYFTRGEFHVARELGEQMLGIAQNVQDSSLLLEAHHLLGNVWAGLGDFSLARRHLEYGISLYDPHQHRNHAFRYGGHDPGVCCQSLNALVLWILGYPERAGEEINSALALARDLAHPVSSALALWLAAQFHLMCKDNPAAQQPAQELLLLAEQQQMPYFSAIGTILLQRALLTQERQQEGITQIREGLGVQRAVGAEVTRTYFLSLLAEALGLAEQTDEALATVEEAVLTVWKGEEHSYEAELYRLKGELTLQQANQKSKGKRQKKLSVVSSQLSVPNPQPLTPSTQAEAEAEACFHKAIDIAQR